MTIPFPNWLILLGDRVETCSLLFVIYAMQVTQETQENRPELHHLTFELHKSITSPVPIGHFLVTRRCADLTHCNACNWRNF